MMDESAIILRVLGGSHAYGLATQDSDLDTVQVYVESARDMLSPGRDRPRSVVTTDPDVQTHPLGRYLHLALNGNPSVLESLWAPRLETDVESTFTWCLGTELVNMRHHFLSKRILPRYRGYMRQQTLRLLGLRGGHSSGKRGRESYVSRDGYDTKYASHVLRLAYQCFELLTTGNLAIPWEGFDQRRERILAVRSGKIEFAEWFREAIGLDTLLEKVVTDLPDEPNRQVVEDWALSTYERMWRH
jgi:hypothetical protein